MATILVVDDISVNRILLVRLLQSEGYDMVEAADGREGLAAALRHRPDLIITDVLMPVMDGYELVRQLRLHADTCGIPVMFYTAHYGEREARSLALSSGVAYVLTKPVEPDELLKVVRLALTQRLKPGTHPETLLPVAEFDRRHLRLVTNKLSEKDDNLRAANVRLRAMIDIGLEFASERDSDRLLERVCLTARDLFGSTRMTIGILGPDNTTVGRVVVSEASSQGWIQAGEPVHGAIARVVRERRTLRGETPSAVPPRQFLAAPVASPSHVYGWMCLEGNVGQAFTDDDEGLITMLAGHVGRAYENGYLYDIARKRTAELEYQISERQQAEKALLEASALQRAIFNSANFSSIATDARGVIQIFNVGAERMLGYAAADVLNTITPADISDPDEVILRAAALSAEFGMPIAPGFEALIFKASRGIEDIYELTYFRKDGSRFPAVVSVTALRDGQDAIIGYLLIGTDNTARRKVEQEWRQAEAARRTSDERYRSLFECAPDGIVIADSGSRYLDANGSICRMLGYTREEMIGRRASDVVVGTQDSQAWAPPGGSGAAPYRREFQLRRKDGTAFEAEVIAALLPDGHTLQMIRDITEPKRFERALQQKNFELEGASRMKSEFLANMSHELRTPLNAIIGFSEVLKDGLLGEMTERQRRFTGDIFNSGVHLLSLINDILDLSKVEAGKMTLDLEPLEVSTFLVNSLAIVKEKATRRSIGVCLDAADALGALRADPRKVRQIVYNLLSNAVKFTPDGGNVTLRAACVARANVGRLMTGWAGRMLSRADSDFAEYLELSVTDTGIGISPEGLQQLFIPFSQVDSGLSRQFEGTGLGLVMVKLLAELHGGAVAVESAGGQGSRFTVWLPFRPLEARAASATVPPVAPTLERHRAARFALVVEDDVTAAESIGILLEAEGFTVLHATSAENALAIARHQPVSLITLDGRLPDMDGWDALVRLREVPDLRETPIVFISMLADRNRGLALGAAAVMEKPIGKEQLCRTLAEIGLTTVGRAVA